MKEFIRKISIYLIIAIGIHVLLGFFADGSTDDFYQRFTSKTQSSLIVGSSRAAQGIQPEVINKILSDREFYNFSFTLNNSSYGEIYNNAILKKIDKKTRNGSFILSVEPWGFIVNKTSKLLSDNIDSISILSKMHYLSLYPNYEYLYRFIKRGWGNILIKRFENKILNSQKANLSSISGSWALLHNDGWLEVNTTIDQVNFAKKLKSAQNLYQNTFDNSKISKLRILAFENLIEELKKYGKVYIVRLPAHPELLKLDNKMMPNFNADMLVISKNHKVGFLDMTVNANKYIYTDGIHMFKTSGASVSREIALRIIELEKHN